MNTGQINPFVSVIIPVFRAEATLKRCVDSVLSQTLENIEIILVDDGSPDHCGEICEKYHMDDQRVKVIHQENSGVSAARQAGIDAARGEYTIHADPDDWMEPNELEELYFYAKSKDADMVICDFYENIGNKQIYHKQEPFSFNSLEIQKEFLVRLHGSMWNKLIRRKCYKDSNTCFPLDLYYCEDLYVVCSLLKNDIKIDYLPKAYYHYVQYLDSQSLVRYYDENTYQHDLKLIQMFNDLFIDDAVCKEYADNKFKYSLVKRAFYYGNRVYDSEIFKKRFYDLRSNVKKRGRKIERFLLYSACCGHYKISYLFYKMLSRMKRLKKYIFV